MKSVDIKKNIEKPDIFLYKHHALGGYGGDDLRPPRENKMK